MCVPSLSGMGDIAARPLPPVADHPSARPSPTSSPSSISSSCCLFTWCQPPVCQLLYRATVLFKVLYCKIKNVLFLCLFFMYYLCDKYYKPITVQHHEASCVCWAPSLTLLDLWTNWTYDCVLRVELVCTQGTDCSLRVYRGRKRPRRELQDHWTFKS